MTQNDFLSGAKFTFLNAFIWWYSPLGKTKGVIRNEYRQLSILEIDKEGFCFTKENWETQRVEFADCKLIEDAE